MEVRGFLLILDLFVQGEVENEMDELVNDLDQEEEEEKDENITKDEQSSSGVESEGNHIVLNQS